jgi:hypothetical protein
MDESRFFFRQPATAWATGVVLPIFSLVLDPIVFRDTIFHGDPLLNPIAPACYCAIGLGMALLVFQLLSRRSWAVVSGMLAGGALFAGLLSLVLAPFGLLGLWVQQVVSFLSVGPLLTSLTFISRSRLELRESPAALRRPLFWCGFLLYITTCVAAQLLAAVLLG